METTNAIAQNIPAGAEAVTQESVARYARESLNAVSFAIGVAIRAALEANPGKPLAHMDDPVYGELCVAFRAARKACMAAENIGGWVMTGGDDL